MKIKGRNSSKKPKQKMWGKRFEDCPQRDISEAPRESPGAFSSSDWFFQLPFSLGSSQPVPGHRFPI